MVLGSVVALQSPAAAAPSNLKDIDATYVYGSLYLAAGLTKGGTLQVQPMVCATDQETCARHGWTTVGQGVAWAEVMTLNSDTVLLVARLTNGKTWYKRGTCTGVRCDWHSWHSLGGNVTSVRATAESYDSCATVGGLSPRGRVYTARICYNKLDYGWKSLGGNLKQIEVDRSGRVFGISPTYTLWWNTAARGYSGAWVGGGGHISQPVVDNGNSSFCGLSSNKRMWCFNTGTLAWTNAGGKWRKLDNGQSIGISSNWSMWGKSGDDRLTRYGGSLNQVAMSRNLQVGVSGSLKPWYRFSDYYGRNTWHPA